MSRNGVRTFGEGRVLRDGIVSVWITSERQMAFSVDHGWRPVGKPMLVTRADRCVVHELDGRPAYETFVSGPGAPLNQSAETFNERALARPVGLPNAQGRYEARQVLDVHEDGSLEFTTAIPEQTVMQVMTGDSDSLLRGAGAAPQRWHATSTHRSAWRSCSPARPVLRCWATESPRRGADLQGARRRADRRVLHVRGVRSPEGLVGRAQLERRDSRAVVRCRA